MTLEVITIRLPERPDQRGRQTLPRMINGHCPDDTRICRPGGGKVPPRGPQSIKNLPTREGLTRCSPLKKRPVNSPRIPLSHQTRTGVNQSRPMMACPVPARPGQVFPQARAGQNVLRAVRVIMCRIGGPQVAACPQRWLRTHDLPRPHDGAAAAVPGR
jgi:hypothetical protein